MKNKYCGLDIRFVNYIKRCLSQSNKTNQYGQCSLEEQIVLATEINHFINEFTLKHNKSPTWNEIRMYLKKEFRASISDDYLERFIKMPDKVHNSISISYKSFKKFVSGYPSDYNDRHNLIFNRDGNQCVLCGAYKKLCVHHIDNDKFNNHPTNLITLCTKCHSKKLIHFYRKKGVNWNLIKRLVKIATFRSNVFFEGENLPAKHEQIYQMIREKQGVLF